jgi:hypothetical protein
MSKNKNLRRRELFDLYASNLTIIKESSIIQILPDVPDTILCPICWQMFERTHLDDPQTLTLDHVPPESLGGKDADGVLLCGNCNHSLGSKVDRPLKQTMQAADFAAGSPGSSVNARLSLGKMSGIDVEIRNSEEGALKILIDGRRVNPAHS